MKEETASLWHKQSFGWCEGGPQPKPENRVFQLEIVTIRILPNLTLCRVSTVYMLIFNSPIGREKVALAEKSRWTCRSAGMVNDVGSIFYVESQRPSQDSTVIAASSVRRDKLMTNMSLLAKTIRTSRSFLIQTSQLCFILVQIAHLFNFFLMRFMFLYSSNIKLFLGQNSHILIISAKTNKRN